MPIELFLLFLYLFLVLFYHKTPTNSYKVLYCLCHRCLDRCLLINFDYNNSKVNFLLHIHLDDVHLGTDESRIIAWILVLRSHRKNYRQRKHNRKDYTATTPITSSTSFTQPKKTDPPNNNPTTDDH